MGGLAAFLPDDSPQPFGREIASPPAAQQRDSVSREPAVQSGSLADDAAAARDLARAAAVGAMAQLPAGGSRIAEQSGRTAALQPLEPHLGDSDHVLAAVKTKSEDQPEAADAKAESDTAAQQAQPDAAVPAQAGAKDQLTTSAPDDGAAPEPTSSTAPDDSTASPPAAVVPPEGEAQPPGPACQPSVYQPIACQPSACQPSVQLAAVSEQMLRPPPAAKPPRPSFIKPNPSFIRREKPAVGSPRGLQSAVQQATDSCQRLPHSEPLTGAEQMSLAASSERVLFDQALSAASARFRSTLPEDQCQPSDPQLLPKSGDPAKQPSGTSRQPWAKRMAEAAQRAAQFQPAAPVTEGASMQTSPPPPPGPQTSPPSAEKRPASGQLPTMVPCQKPSPSDEKSPASGQLPTTVPRETFTPSAEKRSASGQLRTIAPRQKSSVCAEKSTASRQLPTIVPHRPSRWGPHVDPQSSRPANDLGQRRLSEGANARASAGRGAQELKRRRSEGFDPDAKRSRQADPRRSGSREGDLQKSPKLRLQSSDRGHREESARVSISPRRSSHDQSPHHSPSPRRRMSQDESPHQSPRRRTSHDKSARHSTSPKHRRRDESAQPSMSPRRSQDQTNQQHSAKLRRESPADNPTKRPKSSDTPRADACKGAEKLLVRLKTEDVAAQSNAVAVSDPAPAYAAAADLESE